MSSFKIGSFID